MKIKALMLGEQVAPDESGEIHLDTPHLYCTGFKLQIISQDQSIINRII
jgi:hypothetical protein